MKARAGEVPELWERQENEPMRSYQRFCVYRDLPYGIQGKEPQRRSVRNAANSLGLKSKTGLDVLCSRWNWVARAEAYDVYMAEQQRFENERAIYKMREIHASLGEQMINKAAGRLLTIPDNSLSAQDVARLVDVGVKVERMSRGDHTESIAVSGKATMEHTGSVEMSGKIPDMSSLTDQELEKLEQILGKLHKEPSI